MKRVSISGFISFLYMYTKLIFLNFTLLFDGGLEEPAKVIRDRVKVTRVSSELFVYKVASKPKTII